MSQLALPIGLDDHAVFESFLPVGNEELVDRLLGLASGEAEGGCWLWGAPSTGKTHLLQAVCDRAGDRSVYVPIRVLADAGPALIVGLESREIVCIDDLDVVAGRESWERAVFNLYNELLANGGQLIVAASMAPRECGFDLPDLSSRMSQLPTYALTMLGEDDRVAALQLRAEHRGLDLPKETARFLLKRSRRDMTTLYTLLDRLDREALKAKRRLTIPFVRGVLEDTGDAG
ncbi:MAG: DnaA regulatory inactivator Hda [Woeseiaceae bacterium]|nr:DnaA regulatory inactivator Hda [Woeseiaceae bacterium]